MRTEFQGGPNGAVVQDHIDSFFKALQSFFHPSNLGKWNVSPSGHLIKGCVVFVSQRIIYKQHVDDRNVKLFLLKLTD